MSVESEIEQRGVVPDLLGVAEAAALLRVGLTFAYASTARFIATGSEKEIPAIKVGRLTRVPEPLSSASWERRSPGRFPSSIARPPLARCRSRRRSPPWLVQSVRAASCQSLLKPSPTRRMRV